MFWFCLHKVKPAIVILNTAVLNSDDLNHNINSINILNIFTCRSSVSGGPENLVSRQRGCPLTSTWWEKATARISIQRSWQLTKVSRLFIIARRLLCSLNKVPLSQQCLTSWWRSATLAVGQSPCRLGSHRPRATLFRQLFLCCHQLHQHKLNLRPTLKSSRHQLGALEAVMQCN